MLLILLLLTFEVLQDTLVLCMLVLKGRESQHEERSEPKRPDAKVS